jgi:sugar phosphate isomerase/epimerase
MTPSVGAAMDIRFGVTVETFMEYVTELGLDHVEFKREYLSGHPNTPDPQRVGELADEYGVTLTYHAPFRDWNIGSFDDSVRQHSVERVKQTLDDAAAADAAGVVVHGGAVRTPYPEWVQTEAHDNALRSLAECAEYAQYVGVPLCLENQPESDEKQRHTTSPTKLAAVLDTVDVPPQYLQTTLDVGHAKVNGYDWTEFVDEFGERIHICHLHDNDGTADQHEPLTAYEPLVDAIPADHFVFEMKSVDDVARTVGKDISPPERAVPGDD